MQLLNRGIAKPTFVPPRPYERGYRGRPTLIQNPETLAQLALIARFGADWFRELGSEADPGSALVTISGAVASPGVYELAFGTPMPDLLAAAGGANEPLQALLVGGYFGTWVDTVAGHAAAPGPRGSARRWAARWAPGVLIALGESSCGLHEIGARDRLPGAPVGRAVRAVRPRPGGDRRLRVGRSPTAQPASVSTIASCAGRPRSGAAAPATTPTGPRASSRARCRCLADELTWHRRQRCTARSAGLPLDAPASSARQARGAAAMTRSGGRPPTGASGGCAAERQPDHLRGPRPVRRAAPGADPPRRLGLSDPRRPRCSARAAAPRSPCRRRVPDAGAAAGRAPALRPNGALVGARPH